MTIREYYKYYIACHQDRRNQLMHYFGNVATLVYIALMIAHQHYWWLLGSPFVVYTFAYPGHWIFEKNRPAGSLRYLLHAKICDLIMCYRFVRGLPIKLDESLDN